MLVHLPTRDDYEGSDATDAWRAFIGDETAKRGMLFIDMVGELQQIPPDTVDRMFFPAGREAVPGIGGHYTVEGHNLVASRLYARLAALPEVSARLSALRSPIGEER